jgi:hypothetical protein
MNKSAAAKLFLSFHLLLSVVFSFILLPAYADQIKTDNLNNLEMGRGWIGGVASAGDNYAIWSVTVDCSALNLGANLVWSVASGRVLTTEAAGRSGSVNSPANGNFIVTTTGSGVWTTSGNGDNGSMRIIIKRGMVNLNKLSNK